MKRIMALMAVCVVLIYCSLQWYPSSATLVASRTDLLWRIEPVDQNFSDSGVSLGFDGWSGRSMVLYTSDNALVQAVRIGKGLGNCGRNNSWACDTFLYTYSSLNDLAYYEDLDIGYRQASYVYVEDTSIICLRTLKDGVILLVNTTPGFQSIS